MSKPERVEVFRQEDAMKEAVTVIAPQLASDGVNLAELKVDVRRLTRLSKTEIIPISYFLSGSEEGDWIEKMMGNYMNLKMSEQDHERAVLLVEALKAIGGVPKIQKKKRDDRNFIQRHFTQRNQEPDED